MSFSNANVLGAQNVSVESSILSGAAPSAALVAATQLLSGATTITARHVTIADAGAAPATAFTANGGAISATFQQSIVKGPAPGATIDGTNDTASANSALFANSAGEDFHLRVGSPAINPAGGGQVGGETQLTDVEGDPRDATWDRGADEFVNHAPAAPTLVVGPNPAQPGQQVGFAAFAGADPDATRGDTVAGFHFDFGDGTQVDQASPAAAHAYAAAGTYAAKVREIDSLGLPSGDSVPVTVTVAAASGGGGGGGGSGGGPPGPDLAAPALSITSPRSGQRIKRAKRAPVLRGRTSDATGVRTVELALRRFEGRRCRWYDARRRAFRLGSCSAPRFFSAVVNDFGWSYRFPRRIVPRAGRYELRARATDYLGHRTTAVSARAKTLAGFRIVP